MQRIDACQSLILGDTGFCPTSKNARYKSGAKWKPKGATCPSPHQIEKRLTVGEWGLVKNS